MQGGAPPAANMQTQLITCRYTAGSSPLAPPPPSLVHWHPHPINGRRHLGADTVGDRPCQGAGLLLSPVQVGFLPHFLSLVEAHVADPSSTLHGQIDLHNLAAAGHSRGAKIAALHFAGGSGRHRLGRDTPCFTLPPFDAVQRIPAVRQTVDRRRAQ